MTSLKDPGEQADGGWSILFASEQATAYRGHRFPREFSVIIRPPLTEHALELTVRIDQDRGPVPTGVSSWPGDPESDAISYLEAARELRAVDVDKLLQRASADAARSLIMYEFNGTTTDEHREAWQRAQAVHAAAMTVARPRRRHAITGAHLAAVAEVYRKAAPEGSPTKAVAEAFHTTRSTAGRWVVLARERGLLGAADSTRPGELPASEPPEEIR